MINALRKTWLGDEGQDIAEYAVMLAKILLIVVGTIGLVGSNANNVFSGGCQLDTVASRNLDITNGEVRTGESAYSPVADSEVIPPGPKRLCRR